MSDKDNKPTCCAPPEGTKSWSHHWLRSSNGTEVVCRLSSFNERQLPGAMNDVTFAGMAALGYTYLGSVAPFRPHEPAGPGGEVTEAMVEAAARVFSKYVGGGIASCIVEAGARAALVAAIGGTPAQPSVDASRIAGAEAMREAAAKIASQGATYETPHGWVISRRSEHVAAAIRALAIPVAPQGDRGWQDIATAPKDGTRVLLFGCLDNGAPHIVTCWHRDDAWFGWAFRMQPTHWMSLPTPPVTP